MSEDQSENGPNDESNTVVDDQSGFETDFAKLVEGKFVAPYGKFKGYGIFTFWILPIIYGALVIGTIATPLVLGTLGLLLVSLYYPVRHDKEIPKLSSFIYRFARITFGLDVEEKDSYQIRTWWFLLTVPLISLWIIVLLAFLLQTIIPIIIIIWKRQTFLRWMFKITFLPREDYLSFISDKQREEKKKYHDEVTKHTTEYFTYFPPTFKAKVISYFAILIIPFLLAFFIYPAILLIGAQSPGIDQKTLEGSLIQENSQVAGIFLVVGIVSIIPYLILSGPIQRFRLPRKSSSILSQKLLRAVSKTFLNVLPMFKGEYYIEKNSRILDMRDDFSFFGIFERGRLLTIIFIPMTLVSFVLGRSVKRVAQTIGTQEEFNALDFTIELINDSLHSPELIIFLLVVGPLIISILLPMIFALSDAEIKRAVWDFDEAIGINEEIVGVEDFGNTVNNQFKLFLGIGTITSIFVNISQISLDDSIEGNFGPIAVTAFILFAGATITFPGTFFMLYRYMSTGDHSYAVNSLRYFMSREKEFGVGTISRAYEHQMSLPEPPEHIRKELGLLQSS